MPILPIRFARISKRAMEWWQRIRLSRRTTIQPSEKSTPTRPHDSTHDRPKPKTPGLGDRIDVDA